MVFQAILIGLFGWLSSSENPAVGVCAFKAAITGPIAGGLICGIILGDIPTGVIIGCAVQTIYLSNLVIGGAMTADMNFVSYVCIPLAMLSGADVDIAMALAATIGVLGAALFTFYEGACSIFYAAGDRAIDRNDVKAMKRAYIFYPAVLHFPIRFGIPFVSVLLGAQYAENIMAALNSVPWLLNIGKVLGGLLPAVGMAILLAYTLKDIKLIVFYLIGLMAITYMGFNVVAVAVMGACLAVMYYMFTDKGAAKAAIAGEEEDDL